MSPGRVGAGRRAVLAVVLCLLLEGGSGPAYAQDHTPQPYSPDEFPAWMKNLWRAEVIFVGSFPFTLFATLEVFDTYRYVTNNFQASYAPWPFGSGAATPYTAAQTGWLAVSAISLSVVIAGIDFLIGRIHESAARH
jgi:hypothetical protein